MRDGIPFFEISTGRVGPIQLDRELGWRATEDYQESLTGITKGGKPYSVHRSPGRHGFRHFGDVNSVKPKLLIIGDSFTQATAVSDGKTYAALVGKALGMEVFAYGAGGYGTLQEYLILDRYIDEIKPALILWQFCINDFINNDNELEQNSTINNHGLTRPYLVDGVIARRPPKPMGQQVREWVNAHSRFLYFVVSRIDRLRAVTATASVEYDIEAHRIEYWSDVSGVIEEAVRKEQDVQTPDDHWNELGHKLVAEVVSKHLRTRELMATHHQAAVR